MKQDIKYLDSAVQDWFNSSGSENTHTAFLPAFESSDSLKPLNTFLSDQENISLSLNGQQFAEYGYISDFSKALSPTISGEGTDLLPEQPIHEERDLNCLRKLSCSIHQRDTSGALNILIKLVENCAKTFVCKALQNEYYFLLDLAYRNKMDSIYKTLQKCIEVYSKKSLDCSSESIDNFGYKFSSNRRCNTDNLRSLVKDPSDPVAVSFLKIFKKIAKNNTLDLKTIPTLAFAYPFFMDDQMLIDELTHLDLKKEKFVVTFLNSIVLAGFPNGIDQMLSNRKELDQLATIFNVPLILQDKQLRNIPRKQQYDSILQSLGKPSINMYDSKEIALAIMLRDAALIQSIELSRDIMPWLKGRIDKPQSILNVEMAMNKTVRWIAFEIVRKVDLHTRNKIINKILTIGSILLKEKNLHGALQIALALNNPAVNRLLMQSHLDSPDYKALNDLCEVSKLNNYQTDLENEKISILPITKLFWNELFAVYTKINWEKDSSCLESLEEIAKLSSQLLNFRKVPNLKISVNDNLKSAIQMMKNLELVPGEIIIEYSSLCKECDVTRSAEIDEDLRTWNASHFVVLISERSSDKSWIEKFFKKGIYTGKDFIDKFANDKTLIDDMPRKIRNEFKCQYLKAILQ